MDTWGALRQATQVRLDVLGGVMSSADLIALGLSSDLIDAMVRRGVLTRVRRGAFVDGARWTAAPHWDRHALRARAVLRSMDGSADQIRLALSHHSALAVHGIPVYAVDDKAHLARIGAGRGHNSPAAQVHAPVILADTEVIDGVRVVSVALACLQIAATFGIESGLVSADAALHAGVISRSDLLAAYQRGRLGRGSPAARLVVALADGLSESPGETRARWVMRLIGTPTPVLQRVIHDRAGRFVARVDLFVEEHRAVVEFDGMGKYGRAQDLRAEKRREDRLRELGYEVVRLTWQDLEFPGRIRAKLLAAFARAAARTSA